MYEYGQYCPVARATEIVADRWTPLIIRELLAGIRHFNDLDRGLPGISRALLVDRLRRLERTKLLERRQSAEGRVTEYHLTPAGRELQRVIDVLGRWGARWAFADPRATELDPVVLLWWMKRRVYRQRLPAGRTVIEFEFRRGHVGTYWLVLERTDVSGVPAAPEVRHRSNSARRHRGVLSGLARAHPAAGGAGQRHGQPARRAGRRPRLRPVVRLEPDGSGRTRRRGGALSGAPRVVATLARVVG